MCVCVFPNLGLRVRFLDGVPCDLAVAIVFGWLPLESGVKTPHVSHHDHDGWPGLLCAFTRGQKIIKASVPTSKHTHTHTQFSVKVERERDYCKDEMKM